MQKPIDNNMRNRIAEDLNQWNNVESGLYQRHGRKVFHDRQFIRAKRDNYKAIQDKYKKSKLNAHEKAELRIMRSERRALLKTLYPNPYVRLLRNLTVLALNILQRTANLLLKGAKLLFSDSPGKMINPGESHLKKSQDSAIQQAKLIINKDTNTTKQAAKKQQPAPELRKHSTRARMQMTGTTRGLRI